MKIISILLLLSLFALSSCKPTSKGIIHVTARRAMQKIFNSTKEQYHNDSTSSFEKILLQKPTEFAYAGKSDYDKAIEYYEKIIELYPNDAEAYYNMGFAYSNKSDYDKAIECYKKAIILNPDYAEAYNNLSIVEQLKENGK